MTTCIILHNMIVEDERDLDQELPLNYFQGNSAVQQDARNAEELHEFAVRSSFVNFNERFSSIVNRDNHNNLTENLIEHLWRLKRSERQ